MHARSWGIYIEEHVLWLAEDSAGIKDHVKIEYMYIWILHAHNPLQVQFSWSYVASYKEFRNAISKEIRWVKHWSNLVWVTQGRPRFHSDACLNYHCMKQSIKSCKKIGQDGLQRSLFPYCLCFSLAMIGHTLHCRCFLIRITRGKWLA